MVKRPSIKELTVPIHQLGPVVKPIDIVTAIHEERKYAEKSLDTYDVRVIDNGKLERALPLLKVVQRRKIRV